MINLRRAIVWASAGQYVGMAISLASVFVLARLLTPAEYGVVVLASSINSIAEAIREVAGTGYLVRENNLSVEKVRSTTTLSVLVTVLVVLAILLAAEPLAQFFAMPALTSYLGVLVFAYALGPFVHPQMALFARDLAFNRLALINLVTAIVAAGVSIGLACLGFSSLSLAWSAVATAVVSAALGCLLSRDVSIYLPSLSHWRGVLAFGSYSSATALLGKINETLPVFIVGKFLSAEALAIGQRALVLTLIPERLVFAAVGPVALPELSRRAREGEDLKVAYVGALSFISVVQWPAMIVVAILAEPLVHLLLGRQWLEVVPIVRIFSPAFLLAVPIGLQYPILVAAGAVHRLPRLLALQVLVIAAVVLATAPFGLHAVAWGSYVVLPINAGLSLVMVHSAIVFDWRELGREAGRSAFVTLTSAAAPLVIALDVVAIPFASTLADPVRTALTVALAVAGWLAGIHISDHPMKGELWRSVAALQRLAARRRDRIRQ
ncbi:MAG: oligosaccharide flippase family protein [Hyphomicrobiaceae bacterium]